jgi:hypothetical protein
MASSRRRGQVPASFCRAERRTNAGRLAPQWLQPSAKENTTCVCTTRCEHLSRSCASVPQRTNQAWCTQRREQQGYLCLEYDKVRARDAIVKDILALLVDFDLTLADLLLVEGSRFHHLTETSIAMLERHETCALFSCQLPAFLFACLRQAGHLLRWQS